MQKVVILGAGESGVGAALLAKKKGMSVFVSDYGQIAPDFKKQLIDNNIAFEEGKHTSEIILEAAIAIKSPGIAPTVPIVQQLEKKGIAVIDELEFAFRHTTAKIIAITGSNGKTTTTRLIYHLLANAGIDVAMVGNVGFSMAKQMAQDPKDYYVVEMSSFQLDNIVDFRADIAVLLNITADHLDRYDHQVEKYIAAKLRIIENITAEGVFLFNVDDKNIAYGLEHFHAKPIPNKMGVSMNALKNENEVLHVPHTDFQIAKKDLPLVGRHNYFNIQVAILVAKQFAIDNETIKAALMSFENEAHRLESICHINGVEYINDSKATNVEAVYYALEGMQKDIVWIVGGIDKGNDYSLLFDLVKQKVKAIVCLGKDNKKIKAAFGPIHEIIVETRSTQEAIKVASLYAEEGDVVLLSPACSSFDLFENYKARGNQFKELLLQQLEIIEKGVQVKLNVNLKMNPTDNKSDDR